MGPVPKRHRHVRHRVLMYFAYLGKKFNLKILNLPLPGAGRLKSPPSAMLHRNEYGCPGNKSSGFCPKPVCL
jgi:hypothetical protein